MARSKRGIPAINAGSMADIAFLLLIFFLVTTTMDVDTGILVKLPPHTDEQPPIDIKQRNVFMVLVNANNQLLVEDQWLGIKELREKTKSFITNKGVDPNLSESPLKAVVSLQNDRSTKYDTYIQVRNELTAAYNEVRNEEAMKQFGKKYNELKKFQQETIKKMYPQVISEAEPKDVNQ